MNNFSNDTRILAAGREISNDTHVTRLNNNDLIIGTSGTGKTTGYVIPNILRSQGSMVIADTKGQLYKKLGPVLKKRGYDVKILDFASDRGDVGYNPFDFIRYDSVKKCFREEDIMTLAYALLPHDGDSDDYFWENSARDLICCCIAYVMEMFDEADRNIITAADVFKLMSSQITTSPDGCIKGIRFLDEHVALHPNNFSVRKYLMLKAVLGAEKTWACIQQYASQALSIFDYSLCREKLSGSRSELHISDLGMKKSVLFLNVSDTNHTFDKLLNIFYNQLFKILCDTADNSPDGRLKVPVRIYLDDFATNVNILDFDKLISVIRSREISVAIILQSLTQLETLYSHAQAVTVINGCDHILYLGGNDEQTANYLAQRMFLTAEHIMCLPNEKAYLITRGQKGELVDKIMPNSLDAVIPAAVQKPSSIPYKHNDMFDGGDIDEIM